MPNYPTSNPYFESCWELFDGRTGVTYSLDRHRTYQRKFRVRVKIPEMGAIGASLAPDVPAAGSVYGMPAMFSADGTPLGAVELDELAILTQVQAEPEVKGDWASWIVTCTYSTEVQTRVDTPSRSTSSPADKPTDETQWPDVSWDWESAREGALDQDLNGVPHLTMAHQPFSPPPIQLVRYPILNITRNELNFNFNTAQYYGDGLNDATFLTAPPGCVQVDGPPKSTQQHKGKFHYWRTSYKLKFRALQKSGGYVLPKLNILLQEADLISGDWVWTAYPNLTDFVDSWQPRYLNKGMYRLGGTGQYLGDTFIPDMDAVKGQPVPILRHGQQVHHPVLLDEKGGVSRPADRNAQAGSPAARIQPWYMEFTEFRSVSLTTLLVKGVK